MALSTLHVYRSLVPKQYNLAPPSRLYHLEPIGLDTPYTESLTSYISRLAQAHCLKTGHLFASELAPAAGKKYLFPKSKKNESSLSTSFYPATPSLVGSGRIAEDWVHIMELLTLRQGLRYLTMLTWRNILANGATARHFRAWCPLCLCEQKERGRIVYEHLLWAQKYVEICPLHQKPLVSCCPHCGKHLRPLADKTRPGHCSSCGNWLGVMMEKETSRGTLQEITGYQIWAAEQVGELIAKASSLREAPSKERLVASIWKCVQECSGNFIPGFARYFGINSSTVQSWKNYNSIPRFDFLLAISNRLGVSLYEFITDKDLFDRSDLKEKTSLIRIDAGGKIIRRRTEDLRQELLNILSEDRAISIEEVASRLGYKSSFTLKKHHPDLSSRIEDRYAVSVKVEKKNWNERLHDDETIRNALEQALTMEKPQSLNSIAKSIGYRSASPLKFRFPHLCKEIQKRRDKNRLAREEEILNALKAALLEEPPPSPHTVARRVGYVGHAGLRARFPDWCEKLSARLRKSKRVRKQMVRKALKSALIAKKPQSIHAIAKRTGYNSDYLRQLFPDLHKAISERYKSYKLEQSALRKKTERELVKHYAIDLVSKGIYPSAVSIEKEMNKSISFNSMEWCNALQAIRMELGLNRA